MACACKVAQQLDYLHKKYGDNIPKSKETHIRENFGFMLKNILIYMMLIPLTPLLLVYIIFKTIAGKSIRLDKLIKGQKNVGKH